jgi:RNA polymerase sigma-70 factor (ECF subfamily)
MSTSSGGTVGAASAAPPGSDAELVARVAGRDQAAFDVVYRRHVRTVYRAALARVRSVPDAEEVTQETFVTLWRRADAVQLTDSVLPWLLATARYVALNHLRAAATRSALLADADLETQPDAAPGVEATVEQAQLALAIAAAVSTLSETDQQLYRLCIEDELSYADAAARLGVSHGSVRNRLSRVRTALRGDLKDFEKGGRA